MKIKLEIEDNLKLNRFQDQRHIREINGISIVARNTITNVEPLTQSINNKLQKVTFLYV